MATLTLGSNTYTLVPLPSTPGFVDITFTMLDSIAVQPGIYVPSQTQTFRWPGADRWGVQFNLPKMTRSTAAAWKAFLAALEGQANVFQVGDPIGVTPAGAASGLPVVDGAITGGNGVNQKLLNTKGWTPSIYRQLLFNDYLQIGNRLYMAKAEVDSDINGDAQIAIWPSLRETPADGTAIQLVNTVGVFRLVNNQRQWHTTVDGLTQISVQAVEAR